jgi:hypothetical protein
MAYRLQHGRPFDGKLILGALFLLGYYALVGSFSFREAPAPNIGLLRDAMLVLGPPVGAIVNAVWRSDRRDEEQTRTTGEGFRAMQEQAKATQAAAQGTGGSLNDGERPAGTEGDPVHVEGNG